MENVLLQDHRSSGSFGLPKMSVVGGRCRRSLGARSATLPGAYDRFFPTWRPYHGQHRGGAWSSAPGLLPCATPPIICSSHPSLPLLPSNHTPLLPLPPTATKSYAAFPYIPAALPAPPPRSWAAVTGAAATNAVPAAAAPAAPPRQRDRRRRPPPPTTEPTKTRKKKPLERATPLPPAPAVNEALDDLEQEVASNFVQDLLHALAPPPSSLPLPRFSLLAKASSPAVPAATLVLAPAAPSCCNVEAATADAIRGLLRL